MNKKKVELDDLGSFNRLKVRDVLSHHVLISWKGGGAHMFSQSLEGILFLSLAFFFRCLPGVR